MDFYLFSMITINSEKQSLIITIAGGAILAANALSFHSPVLGVIGFFLYSVPLVKRFEGPILLPAFILLSTIVYYIHGMDTAATLAVLAIPILTFFLLKYKNKPAPNEPDIQRPRFDLLAVIAGLIDILLLAYIILHRTSSLLPSPWTALHARFFIAYAFATLFLMISACRSRERRMHFLSLHFFTAWSIAALLYPLGFGFDAFVHRATEFWIQTHGFILPKEPYYIGQYASMVWLGNITAIPVFFLDIFFVPVFAAISLPFRAGWRYPASAFLILFLPALALFLTTPHNVALLLSILCVFAIDKVFHENTSFKEPSLLALAALATHPLIGAPLIVFTFAAFIIHTFQSRILHAVTVIAATFVIAFTPIFLFSIQIWRVTRALPSIANPLRNINSFLSLFERPYWYASHAPRRFELLYAWEQLIVPATILLCATGLILFIRKEKKIAIPSLSLAGSIALFTSAFLLRSWIVFPNVVSYEQGDYPVRLIHASILFLLPFGGYAIATVVSHWHAKRARVLTACAAVVASVLLMFSLYLSYPQRNIKVRFPGFNVTSADFHAVEWIHGQHSSYEYIVLANQLTSAAALAEYSFARYFSSPAGPLFYYSLPTGGPLYRDYGRMIYEGQKREYMMHAMDLAGVRTAYFVVNRYWARAEDIIASAKKTADRSQSIDDGAVWVFEYNR